MLHLLSMVVLTLSPGPEALRKNVDTLADTMIKKRQFWAELQRQGDDLVSDGVWSFGKKKAYEFEVRRLSRGLRQTSDEFFAKARLLGEFLDVEYRENQLRWKTAVDSRATMDELRELASESTSNADLEQFLDHLSSRLSQVPAPITIIVQNQKRSFWFFVFLAPLLGFAALSLTKLIQRQNRYRGVRRT